MDFSTQHFECCTFDLSDNSPYRMFGEQAIVYAISADLSSEKCGKEFLQRVAGFFKNVLANRGGMVYNKDRDFAHPPVAKLDIAVDSDSKGRGFESLRAGQKQQMTPTVSSAVFYVPPEGFETRPRFAKQNGRGNSPVDCCLGREENPSGRSRTENPSGRSCTENPYIFTALCSVLSTFIDKARSLGVE